MNKYKDIEDNVAFFVGNVIGYCINNDEEMHKIRETKTWYLDVEYTYLAYLVRQSLEKAEIVIIKESVIDKMYEILNSDVNLSQHLSDDWDYWRGIEYGTMLGIPGPDDVPFIDMLFSLFGVQDDIGYLTQCIEDNGLVYFYNNQSLAGLFNGIQSCSENNITQAVKRVYDKSNIYSSKKDVLEIMKNYLEDYCGESNLFVRSARNGFQLEKLNDEVLSWRGSCLKIADDFVSKYLREPNYQAKFCLNEEKNEFIKLSYDKGKIIINYIYVNADKEEEKMWEDTPIFIVANNEINIIELGYAIFDFSYGYEQEYFTYYEAPNSGNGVVSLSDEVNEKPTMYKFTILSLKVGGIVSGTQSQAISNIISYYAKAGKTLISDDILLDEIPENIIEL